MDPHLASQQSAQEITPISPPPAKPAKKLPLFFLAGGFFAILLLAGSYYLRAQNSNADNTSPIITPAPIISLSAPTTNPPPPNDETTLSYAYIGDTVYLQYRGKFFGQDIPPQIELQELPESALPQAMWNFVLQAPLNTQLDNFNELFSFRTVPTTPSFLFVMRWTVPAAPNTITWEYPVYLYNPKSTVKNLTKLNLAPSTQASYDVPKIGTFSADGKFISFRMFSCWNCGGHMPETLLMNLQTGQSKRIGKVSSFTWKENGMYSYTEYKVIPCESEDVPVACSEKPENLPLKTGTF